MKLIFLILFAAAALILLSFIIALKVKVAFNSDIDSNTELNILFSWMDPFIRAFVIGESGRSNLIVYLFGKKVWKKTIEKKQNRMTIMDIIKLTKPRDVNVDVEYGFKDPSLTGAACGAISAASGLLYLESFSQKPDFLAENDYISLNATAKVNLGSALIKMLD